ncbi:MAG TPA: Tim44/TimA family putative adaptor protein [Dongiaceae bacterium]|nr:Tim44/TimA family putative adaptor protein [Dongiaceae bacterium]
MFFEILFFAVVAGFLGWRLYSVLGRRTGHEKPFDPFRTNKEPEAPATVTDREGNIRRLPEPAARAERVDRDRRKLEAAIAGIAGDVRRGLDEIRSADPKFDPVDFVAGARVAFDMILGAFAQGETKALRPLLNDQVFGNFAGAIEDRNRNRQKHETTLVGILSADIVAAALKGDEAQVTVKFVSQQINVTKDQEGRIVDGDPSEVANITDIWTFARQVKARDPNWVLTGTDSPQ